MHRAVFSSDAHGNFKELYDVEEDIFFLGDFYKNSFLVNNIFREFMKVYKSAKKIEKMKRDEFKEKLYNKLSSNNNGLANLINKKREKIEQVKLEYDIPKIFKEKKADNIYTLPGNHDDKEFYEGIRNLDNVVDLHNSKIKFNDTLIVGFGGFIVPYAEKNINIENYYWYSDSQMAENISNIVPRREEKVLLLMHETPVRDYCRKTREAIEERQVNLVIGGHNHHQAGESRYSKINDVEYINCSSLLNDEYIIYNI